ncbi:MAG: glutamate-5-semialdehyde dehydrogenase [Sulfobacillus benefaciens]|uniref:Gamma-glutamyl phosphate reductase n=1 Tax=Sulfobacillus benefaciens TaxID=453960 RepID=A0A2T2XKJ7_9FIRM|nr:MAG: glutamate-5-semialdehyde dehydrogenase [Sulfobacillus benefaciens]
MLNQMLERGRTAQKILAMASGDQRNRALSEMEHLLQHRSEEILKVNRDEVEKAAASGLKGPLLKRLMLDEHKIANLGDGLRVVRDLADPLGKGTGRWQLNNGLRLETIRVPLGVIGLIYESRPGVTIEAAGLTIKSGNALILRGGHEALETNRMLAALWRYALTRVGLPEDAVQLIENPDRQYAVDLMHLEGLDLLIPRGGAGLIQTVVREATVPVIETGVGNCHLYVHEDADLDMAVRILRDGKVGNPAVCNALETVLIHEAIAAQFLAKAKQSLADDGVVWHGDQVVCSLVPEAKEATEEDWANEYLSLDIAARVVSGLGEACEHIAQYGTSHSEAIVTDSYSVGREFMDRVDAAVVYWNASTRFTDGFQFGLGAEVGISTQKLHARGPMGLDALTTTKTLAWGTGQTRDLG